MGPRLDENETRLSYPIELEKVNQAFKMAGLFSKLYDPPTEADFNYISRKNLTIFQWRLLNLFKKMLDDELYYAIREYDIIGVKWKVHKYGIKLRDKMLRNPVLAEKVFSVWAERLDIKEVYNQFLKHRTMSDFFAFESWVCENECDCKVVMEDDFEDTSIVCSSDIDVYERFYSILRHLCVKTED